MSLPFVPLGPAPAATLSAASIAEVASAVAAVSRVVIPSILAADIADSATTTTRYRGTDWDITISDIGDEPTKLYFTVKSRDEADSEAVIQVVLTIPSDADDGLIRLNGAAAENAAWGSIAVSTYVEDSVTKRRAVATIKAAATKDIATRDHKFDFKTGGSDPEVLGGGILKVLADVTRATS